MVYKPTLWHANSDFYGIRTPTFMPYEPFLLGVGVVFYIYIYIYIDKRHFLMRSGLHENYVMDRR